VTETCAQELSNGKGPDSPEAEALCDFKGW